MTHTLQLIAPDRTHQPCTAREFALAWRLTAPSPTLRRIAAQPWKPLEHLPPVQIGNLVARLIVVTCDCGERHVVDSKGIAVLALDCRECGKELGPINLGAPDGNR